MSAPRTPKITLYLPLVAWLTGFAWVPDRRLICILQTSRKHVRYSFESQRDLVVPLCLAFLCRFQRLGNLIRHLSLPIVVALLKSSLALQKIIDESLVIFTFRKDEAHGSTDAPI
ncbi:uncharacterized protein BKA78DRAFT_302688, partial [Phyllosticta capitalensis]|uniref:uncharacterized protein n=1 Tax=Phyllosticta capitalensis TaxID=121624 RepID=UPI003131A6C7